MEDIGRPARVLIAEDDDSLVVEVTSSCADGLVEVAVVDHGLGTAHVFEKFLRVERGAAARIGGTGLAPAHEIVLAHGGRMGFASTEGEGSRFWFELPPPDPQPSECDESAPNVCQNTHKRSLRPMLPLACSP